MQCGNCLFLQYLIDKNIIKLDETDEVLPILPRESASSIAVTVVSSFSPDGSSPALNSEMKIDWMMQAVAYCLTLTTLYEDAIQNAINIFEFWLLKGNSFLSKEKRNKYARQFIKYMSLVCEFKTDNTHPSYRKGLISQLEKAWMKCARESSYFDQETWETLIRVCIGCADYLLSNEATQTLTECISRPLASDLFEIIFFSAQRSNITSKELWKTLIEYMKKWAKEDIFISRVCDAIYKEYCSIISLLIDKETLTVTNADVSMQCFRISQYINNVDLEIVTTNQDLFTLVSLMLEKAFIASQSIIESSAILYTPFFPADVFFSFFGRWIFNPFRNCNSQFMKIHASIIMRISGKWDLFNSKWRPLLLSTLMKSFKMNIPLTLMRDGHYILTRFYNDQIINGLIKVINRNTPKNFVDSKYWSLYSLLIEDISEVRVMDESVFASFFECCKEVSPLTRIFTVLMRQNPNIFMKYSMSFFEKVFSSQSPFIKSILANLNIIIAASLPFDSIPIEDYLKSVFEIINENNDNSKLLTTFLILVMQITKWRNEAFDSDFASKFTEFAQEVLVSNADENIKITEHMICGRPIDTTILDAFPLHLCTPQLNVDERLYMKPFFTVLVGNHLVSLVGDKTRKNSFVVHVREPRGFFVWELNSLYEKNTMTFIKNPTVLDTAAKEKNNFVNTNDCSIEGAVDEMHNLHVSYPNYTKPSDHRSLPHISVLKNQLSDQNQEVVPLRNTFIDFLIQTGLGNSLSEVNEPIEDALSKFDQIPTSAIIKVSLHHFSHDNKPDSSPVYTYFKSLLGELHYFNENKGEQIRIRNLGIAQIAFHESFISEIGIIFSESVMRININNEEIPKKDLLLVVQPFQQGLYKVTSYTKVEEFSWNIPYERIIKYDNIGRSIATTIFAYYATQNAEELFEPYKKREEILNSIKKSPVDSLKFTQCMPLNLPNLVN